MSSDAKSAKYQDLTGWALGEKKTIKDSITKDFDQVKAAFEKLGFGIDVDLPAFAAAVSGESNWMKAQAKKNIGELFPHVVKQFVEAIAEFCGNADYKEALKDAVKSVLVTFQSECKDSKGAKGAFEIKDKVLIMTYQSYYAGTFASFDKEAVKKFLEKAL